MLPRDLRRSLYKSISRVGGSHEAGTFRIFPGFGFRDWPFAQRPSAQVKPSMNTIARPVAPPTERSRFSGLGLLAGILLIALIVMAVFSARRVSGVNSTLAESQAQVVQAQNESAKLQAQLGTAQEQITRLQTQLQEGTASVEKLNADHQKALSDLQAKVDEAVAASGRSRSEIQAANLQIEKQLADSRTADEAHAKQVEELNARIAATEKEAAEARDQAARLQQQLEQLRATQAAPQPQPAQQPRRRG